MRKNVPLHSVYCWSHNMQNKIFRMVIREISQRTLSYSISNDDVQFDKSTELTDQENPNTLGDSKSLSNSIGLTRED
jgi:hypothetical protein